MCCTQRSKPHNPTRLAITNAIREKAASRGSVSTQIEDTAARVQPSCQVMDHKPALMGPTLFMVIGASQVADISMAVEAVRKRPMVVEVSPTDRI